MSNEIQKADRLPIDISAKGLERVAESLLLLENALRGMATAARARDITRFRDYRSAAESAFVKFYGYAGFLSDMDGMDSMTMNGLDAMEVHIADAAAILAVGHGVGCTCALCMARVG